MGKAKRTKVFAAVKRMISPYDNRKKENQKKSDELEKKKKEILQVAENPSSLFFKYNMNLGPPFRIIVDTNFINFSIKNKLEMLSCMMNCLLAKCIPCITDCVLGELEKFGSKYRLALMLAKDPRFERLSCTHKGTYADDCIVNRVTEHRCYIVATCDKDLKKRIRKIPGVPIMFLSNHRYTIERMPEAFGGNKLY